MPVLDRGGCVDDDNIPSEEQLSYQISLPKLFNLLLQYKWKDVKHAVVV